MCDMVDASGYS